ncbi:MAG: GtrA family protein [Thermoplasmata archaeon]
MSQPVTTAAAPVPPPLGGSMFLVKYGKFFLVGLTGVIVNLVVFTFALDAISPSPTFNFITSVSNFLSQTIANPTDALIASAIAFAVATLWNFAWNNAWTFHNPMRHRHRVEYRLALYYAVSLVSLAVNEIVLFLSSHALPPLYGQAIGILLGSVVGFAGNYRLTFAAAEMLGAP